MLRSVRSCVLGTACALALAVPALAQTPAVTSTAPAASAPAQSTSAKTRGGDIEAGVALFNRVTNKGEDSTYGPGWYVGGSYQITPTIALVGQFTADYDDVDGRTANIYTYTGGPRFQWKNADRVRPYLQILFGAGQDNGIFAASSTTNYYPVLTSGVGADLAVTDSVAVRGRFDVPILMKFSDSYVGTRLSVGIIVPLGRR